ncbi:hypothetical protein S40293_05704 [Stachybotrys chartarum IBT 40293]|nr:hypothetical protein S40293_05704 [Stachybotrys chartarum IBT 40293]
MRAASVFILAAPSVLAVVFRSCTKDNLFSSLAEDGINFCSSVLDSHCASVATRTQFTMYKSSLIASQCDCVLTERAIPGVSSTPGVLESTTPSTPRTPPGPAQPSVTGDSSSVFTLGSSLISFNDTAVVTRSRTVGSLTYTIPEPSFTGWNSTVATASVGSGTRVFGTGSLIISPRPSAPISGTVGFTIPPFNWTTATPTFLTPTGLNGTVSLPTINATGTIPTTPVVVFTQVAQTAYSRQSSCYALPTSPGSPARRALLQNSKLREAEAEIPYPYIESLSFDSQGLDPLVLTIRDFSEGTYMIDISNKTRLAVSDLNGNSMVICPEGIFFSTAECQYDISILVEDMFAQLGDKSGIVCSGRGYMARMKDMDFTQTLYLQDQCGDPVTRDIRKYPRLKVGETECTGMEIDEDTGRWEFDCTFPGSESSILQCQKAVVDDVVDFLFTDPFGGECPDLSSVITTLASALQLLASKESLKEELYNQDLTDEEKDDADEAVSNYLQLWRILKHAFLVVGTESKSALEQYVDVYNTYRDLKADVCESIHSDEIPLQLTLVAGASIIPAITTLNWSPSPARTYNLTVQDPSSIACCAPSYVATTSYGSCAYPGAALIGDTGCVCGRTVDGRGLAFERRECGNPPGECKREGDCGDGLVCVTGTCCGRGVCVDPYACAQKGTGLVDWRL